jgi:hypothetical protein
MDVISPDSTWLQRLRKLMAENQPDLQGMGFPQDWQSRSLWQELAE